VTRTLSRRLVAEAAGTALIVATIVGSGLMAEGLKADPALQLLCNALATAAMLGIAIAVLGPVSGAHFNPAVSLAIAVRRELAWRDLPAYWVAQLAGGIAGTWLAHLMFEEPVLQVSDRVRGGAGAWISEGLATFGLLAVIVLAQKRTSLPLLVASYIGAAYWFTASTSFANPAVTIARSLTDSFSGIRPEDVPAFVAAQFAGALLAVVAVGWVMKDRAQEAS
jgi:glycerol uptake facilitator-like aquaporin